MGTSVSKPQTVTTDGHNSNTDVNSVNIIQEFSEHKTSTGICLSIIVVLLVIHFVYKFYTLHKRCIVKRERQIRQV